MLLFIGLSIFLIVLTVQEIKSKKGKDWVESFVLCGKGILLMGMVIMLISGFLSIVLPASAFNWESKEKVMLDEVEYHKTLASGRADVTSEYGLEKPILITNKATGFKKKPMYVFLFPVRDNTYELQIPKN